MTDLTHHPTVSGPPTSPGTNGPGRHRSAPAPGARPGPAGLRRRPRRSRHRPVWDEEPTRLGSAAKGVTLIAVVLVVIFPLYTVVLTSFSTQAHTIETGGLVVIPGELTAAAYLQILSGGVVTRAALVSVGITTVGTLLSTTVS